MKEKDLGYILFEDDIFPMNDSFLNRFIELYKKEINLPFFIHLCPEQANFRKLKLLKEAGLDTCSAGIQTASARIKQVYNRKSENKDVIKIHKILNALKIKFVNDIIIAPFEDINDIMKTARLVFKIRKGTEFHFHKLIFYKNYPLTNVCIEKNIITPDKIVGLNFKAEQLIANIEHLEIEQIKFYLILKMSSLGVTPEKAKQTVLLFKNDEKLLKLFMRLFLFYEYLFYISAALAGPIKKFIKGDVLFKEKCVRMLFFGIKNYNGTKCDL